MNYEPKVEDGPDGTPLYYWYPQAADQPKEPHRLSLDVFGELYFQSLARDEVYSRDAQPGFLIQHAVGEPGNRYYLKFGYDDLQDATSALHYALDTTEEDEGDA